ncbi:MAG: esterase-like activity of phytase family protein [Prevotella sp.]|nr:esterase-like activity of phytase family protein [Prevotella sp.]
MRLLHLIILLGSVLPSLGQLHVTENKQRAFPNDIPAGDYSGIAWLGNNHYAVVSDKEKEDGFFIWEINTDSVSGEILSARNLGFHSSGFPNRDDEDIVYVPSTDKLWITGEADNRIMEYNREGMRTPREVQLPERFHHLPPNRGLEALSYNAQTQSLWTCNESDTIYIQQFDSLLQPVHTYLYHLDAPQADAAQAQYYAHGIGTICALDDGSILLLEREFYVPHAKIGAFVHCKLYQFAPDEGQKVLKKEWRTSLTLFGRSLANYEGSCLGPTLADGSRVMILVADSQHQYGGVLKDWLKSLRLEWK